MTILEQAFIIYRIGTYSGNLRNELKASRKIYFTDNGIRNALIADFRPVELRDDIGKLWENFLISERIKTIDYNERFVNMWFWRTQAGAEIDYLEEKNGKLSAFEFKWNPKAKVKQPRSFLEAYPNSSFEVIHKDNYMDFLL